MEEEGFVRAVFPDDFADLPVARVQPEPLFQRRVEGVEFPLVQVAHEVQGAHV